MLSEAKHLLRFFASLRMTTRRASIAEGCKKSLSEFARTLCTPANSLSYGYPWACRIYAPGEIDPDMTGNNDTLMGKMANHAKDYCLRPSEKDMDELPTKVQADIIEVLTDLKYQMQMQLKQECETKYWGGGGSLNLDPAIGIWASYNEDQEECSSINQKATVRCSFHSGTQHFLTWGTCLSE